MLFLLLAAAGPVSAQQTAQLSLCVGHPLDECLASIRAQYRIDDAELSRSLGNLDSVDVNGKPLSPYHRVIFGVFSEASVISKTADLTLSKDRVVLDATLELRSLGLFAKTEDQYAKTGILKVMSALFDAKCWDGDKMTLYRWFENSVKPAVLGSRVDRRIDPEEAEESNYRHTPKLND